MVYKVMCNRCCVQRTQLNAKVEFSTPVSVSLRHVVWQILDPHCLAQPREAHCRGPGATPLRPALDCSLRGGSGFLLSPQPRSLVLTASRGQFRGGRRLEVERDSHVLHILAHLSASHQNHRFSSIKRQELMFLVYGQNAVLLGQEGQESSPPFMPLPDHCSSNLAENP